MVTGTPMAYVAAAGHRPIPMAPDDLRTYRPHTTGRAKKPEGLDWDSITPSCRVCDAKSTELNADRLCRVCCPRPAGSPAPAAASAPASTPRGGTRSRADRRKIVQLYQDGKTVAEIRVETGYSLDSIRRHLHASRIPLRDDRKSRTARGTQTVPAQGIRDLLEAAGVTSHDVKAWAVKHGHLLAMGPGTPPRRVVDAYLAAHGGDE